MSSSEVRNNNASNHEKPNLKIRYA